MLTTWLKSELNYCSDKMMSSIQNTFSHSQQELSPSVVKKFFSCAQYAGQKPPAPSRGTKSSSKDGEDEDEEEEEVDGEEGGGVNVADLVPRNDIR